MASLRLETDSYWRESIDLSGTIASVQHYGTGALPVIDGADGVAAAAWQPTSSANLYTLEWTIEALVADETIVAVWRNALPLTLHTSVSALQADGQVFVEGISETEVRVHVYATQDPRAAPDGTYEISKRAVGVRLGYPREQVASGSSVTGVCTRRTAGREASIAVGRGATIRQSLAEDGNNRSVLVGSGLVEDVTAWGCYTIEETADLALFAAYLTNPAGEEVVFRRTRARGYGQDNLAAYRAHGAGSAVHQHVQFAGAAAEYCDTGFHVQAAGTSVLAEVSLYCYAAGCSHAVKDEYAAPHSLLIDGLLIRAVNDGAASYRPNQQGISLRGISDTVTIRNMGIAMDAGISVWCDSTVSSLVIENCILYHTSPEALLNLHLRAASVMIRRCIIVGGNSALIDLEGVNIYTGEQNIFVAGDSGFTAIANGVETSTLSAWQTETGQDADSVEISRLDLSILFAGDPQTGDFRLGFSGAGMTARTIKAGLEQEIVSWPVLTGTVADEAARLVAPPAPPPPVQLLTPYRITDTSERLTFSPASLDGVYALRLRWLANEILTSYPDATTDLDVARCLRDWIARTAIHPYPYFHLNVPQGTGNETLPVGSERADIVPLEHENDRMTADSQHWATYNHNGYGMLCDLLGLDVYTGDYVGNGQMTREGTGHWRMNDISTYRFVLCSYQQSMLQMLLAAAGHHAILISTVGHDPGATWLPSLGKWILNDPTYNETYLLDGVGTPLSPVELMAYTASGDLSRLTVSKMLTSGGRVAPTWATGVYLNPDATACTYLTDFHPDGFVIMGSLLSNENRWSESGPGGAIRLCMIDVPARLQYPPFDNESVYPPCATYEAFPHLGCAVLGLTPTASGGASIQLATAQPDAVAYEQSVQGAAWMPCDANHVVAAGIGEVRYRSVDAAGRPSSTATITA